MAKIKVKLGVDLVDVETLGDLAEGLKRERIRCFDELMAAEESISHRVARHVAEARF